MLLGRCDVRRRGRNWSSTNCANLYSQLFICSLGGVLIPTAVPLERHRSVISRSSQSCPRPQIGRAVSCSRDSLTFNEIKAAQILVKAEVKKISCQRSGPLSTALFSGARRPFSLLTRRFLSRHGAPSPTGAAGALFIWSCTAFGMELYKLNSLTLLVANVHVVPAGSSWKYWMADGLEAEGRLHFKTG